MDVDKLKQWMEIAQKYQVGDFWSNVFEHKSADSFMQDPSDEESPLPPSRQEKDFPLIDMYIIQSQIVLLIEIPGLEKKDVQLTVSGNKLTIKGNSFLPFTPDKTILKERMYGEFQRSIELPDLTEDSPLRAKFNHGLIVVTYPKKFEREEILDIE